MLVSSMTVIVDLLAGTAVYLSGFAGPVMMVMFRIMMPPVRLLLLVDCADTASTT